MRRWVSLLFTMVLTAVAVAQDEAEFPFDMIAEGVNVVSSAQDEAKTREFYHECLGLEEIAPIALPGDTKMLRFMAGVTELKFIVMNEPLPNPPGGIDEGLGIRMLTVFVNDREGVTQRLEAKGYDTSRFYDGEGELQWSGYVRDPDENEISVVFLPDPLDMETYRRMRINLVVRDLAESRKFYGEVLGLEELAPSSSAIDKLEYQFQAGPTTIRFLKENPDAPAPTEPVFHDDAIGMYYIQFIVQDVDKEFAKLVENGAPIAREPFDLGSLARIAMVFDPNGTVIELAGPQRAGD